MNEADKEKLRLISVLNWVVDELKIKLEGVSEHLKNDIIADIRHEIIVTYIYDNEIYNTETFIRKDCPINQVIRITFNYVTRKNSLLHQGYQITKVREALDKIFWG